MSLLTQFIVKDKLISESELNNYIALALNQGLSTTSYLLQNKLIKDKDLINIIHKYTEINYFDLTNFDPLILSEVEFSHDVLKKHEMLPIKIENGNLLLGLVDPTQSDAIEFAKFTTGLNIQVTLLSYHQFHNIYDQYLSNNSIDKNLEKILLADINLDEEWTLIQENVVNYDEPIIRVVDNIIQQAVEKNATDIHIENYEHHCRIRFRKNGILYEVMKIPIKLGIRIITRLKVISKLDIAEKRLPQDGRIQINNTDIRINTCPTLHGEKLVLRLLNNKNLNLDIEALGLTEIQKKIYIQHLLKPQGLILVTGPTGSGKTVTLYSGLNFLNTSTINISTIEDPIEIKLNGINQININPKINLLFSTILKSLLRQDPDVIMVGEIRDIETAELAINASQTGHLVLSSLHTNSAIETLTRLLSMKIPNYLLINALSLIIAQRLIRKLCDCCKQPTTITKYFSDFENVYYKKIINNYDSHHNIIYQAKGCPQCIQGYQNRVGIFETLIITEEITELILKNASKTSILKCAQQQGFETLEDNGIKKVFEGVTSFNELTRVLKLDRSEF